MYDKKPGVGDNKSYKDMYHFNDNFFGSNTKDDLPSINVDPKINDTIKANPYKSNVEIEGDEIVLKPDLTALFKAKGKKHSRGGMDVMLEPNSFVFSDDKSLSFSEKDHKMFEFKKGGTFSKQKNTPADVLKRNVDTKHYNTLISNITDIKKDDLAKKSSTLMLEKYIEKLGQIAFLQETKKGLPTGVPDFAANTAPIYNTDVKTNVQSQKQYAKYGGKIENPYKMGMAGLVIDDCPCGRDSATGKCKPCTSSPEDQAALKAFREKSPVVPAVPAGYNNIGTPGKELYSDTDMQEMQDAAIGTGPQDPNWKNTFKNLSPTRQEELRQIVKTRREKRFSDNQVVVSVPPPKPYAPATTASVNPNLTPGSGTGAAETGRDINWDFNKYQRASQAYNAFKLATAKRYMPYRSHLNPSYVDPSLVNPEQTTADMQGSANQQIGALSQLSPILRNAQASEFYGQLMDKMPGVRSQYDNQNAGIINQTRAMNNQTTNNARATNMQNDQQYYKESIIGQQNYDNLKTFMGDQYANNVVGDVQDNQSLAYNLATLNNPAYNYNFRTMGYERNKKNILDGSSSGRGDDIEAYAKSLIDTYHIDPAKAFEIATKAAGIKTFGKLGNTAKKGGRVVRNPYK